MDEWIASLLLAAFGLAGGLIVGSGLVALLVVLDLIPRLAQITRTQGRVRAYEGAVVLGAVGWTLADFFGWPFPVHPAVTAPLGILAGCFVGMLAAALTEVLNVLPILAKRIRMESVLMRLLTAMALGKVVGSLFDWIVYQSL